MAIIDNKIYRWMTLEICIKNLVRGLAFGCVSQYVDETEFTAIIVESKRRHVIKYLRRYRPKDIDLLYEFINVPRKQLAPALRDLAKKYDLRKELSEHYYICSLTDNPSNEFSWTDKEERKPLGRFCINYEIFKQEHDYDVDYVKYSLEKPKINIFNNSIGTLKKIAFNKSAIYNGKDLTNEREVRALLDTNIKKYKDKTILYEDDLDYPYIYEKLLHEYLESILIPEEMFKMEGASEAKKKIDQLLHASRNVEEQLSLCREFKYVSSRFGWSQCIPLLEEMKQKKNSSEFSLLNGIYNHLHCYQRHSTISEMFNVLDENVNVDARLNELAKTPKYAHVKIE